jgi:hypothetical protein
VLCQGLLADKSSPAASPAAEAVRILVSGLGETRALPCVKGYFFDAMEHKLNRLARVPTDELVSVDFSQVIDALNRQSPSD